MPQAWRVPAPVHCLLGLLCCAGCRSEDVVLGPAILDQPVTGAGGAAPSYGCDETLDLAALVAAPPSFVSPALLYLDDAEITALRERLAAGQEPSATAFDQALCDARDALDVAPFSVTLTSDPSNDFRTDDPACGWPLADSPCGLVCCSGTFSPAADRDDYFGRDQPGSRGAHLGARASSDR